MLHFYLSPHSKQTTAAQQRRPLFNTIGKLNSHLVFFFQSLFHSFLCSRCVRLESWSWRRSSTPNSSSSIAHQRPWSNGPGTSTVRTGMHTKAAGHVGPPQSLKQVQRRLEQTLGSCLISTTQQSKWSCSSPKSEEDRRCTRHLLLLHQTVGH